MDGRATTLVDISHHEGEPTMSDAGTAIDRYLTALNELDGDKRRALIEQAWTPTGSLTDPPVEGVGHDGLAAVGDMLHEHYAGHRFERTSQVDVHHGRYRVAWALVAPDGTTAVTGIDTGVLADDGRVGDVVGFFGELAPLA
jgi:hypothetical protein